MKIFRALLALSFVAISTFICQAQTTNGLVAYYPLDGDVHDLSGNGQNGNAPNGVSYFPHLVGAAAHLSGNSQYISLPNTIPVANDLTFSVWVRTGDSTPNTFPWALFIASRDIAEANDDWNIGIGQGRKVEFHTGTTTNDLVVLTTPDDIASNEWVHVTCVADSGGSAKRIYINGQLTASTAWTPRPFANSSSPIYLGNATAGTDLHPYLAGDVDEVRIYNRVLSENEIQDVYNAGQIQLNRGLLAYYPFEGNFNDASGNNQNGAAHGAVSFVPHLAGMAASLSGAAQYISLPGTIPAPDEMTFAVWIKTGASTGGTFPWGLFIASRDIAQATWDWNVGIGQGRKVEFHTGTTTNDLVVLTTPGDIASNEWVHVACVANAGLGSKRVYVNGQLAAETQWTPHAFANAGTPIFLGNATAGTDLHPYLAADMDDVRFYNRPLSPEEIAALYGGSVCAPHRAAALAVMSGDAVASATITDGGCGYSNAPSVSITGGGGSGATAYAQISGGVVTNIVISSGGSGYTSVPIILIDAPSEVPVSPFITTQPHDLTVTTGQNALFSVVAGGTPPLSYQWWHGNSAVSGATGSSLSLTGVTLSDAGVYSVVVTNEAGSITSSNATLTVNFPPANVRVVPVSGQSGHPVIVPVALVANGNENALGFSLNFNPAVLSYSAAYVGSGGAGAALIVNDSQAGTGHVGFVAGLDAGATFAAGTQQVVLVTFNSAIMTTGTSTPIGFGDSPLPRQVADVNGNLLGATYTSGSVSITAADFEGDLSPRPNGNKVVDISDWVLAGRYAARLDYPTNGAEFQRADCAPRGTAGDGSITVIDWVQTGRYAAHLDPLTLAGGPTGEGPLKGLGTVAKSLREVHPANELALEGQTVTVRLLLEAEGNENALGLSLSFDPTLLTYQSAAVGTGISGALFNANAQASISGRLGFVLALPTGTSFPAGTREVVRVTFRAAATTTGDCALSLTDQPVPRQVSDPLAMPLDTSYFGATVSVMPPPTLNIALAGNNVTLSWPTWATNFVLKSAPEATSAAIDWTAVTGTVTTNGSVLQLNVPTTGAKQYFRLQSQ